MSSRFVMDDASLAGLAADNFKAAGRVADDVLGDMQRGCPVDTGKLLRSLGVEVDHGRKTYRVGSADVDYAEDVELGTSREAAQPFMRPAAYRERAM